MPGITARPDSNRLHVTTNLLQCAKHRQKGCGNPNFLCDLITE